MSGLGEAAEKARELEGILAVWAGDVKSDDHGTTHVLALYYKRDAKIDLAALRKKIDGVVTLTGVVSKQPYLDGVPVKLDLAGKAEGKKLTLPSGQAFDLEKEAKGEVRVTIEKWGVK